MQETHCQLHHHYPTLAERDSAPGPGGCCPLEPRSAFFACPLLLRVTRSSFVVVCLIDGLRRKGIPGHCNGWWFVPFSSSPRLCLVLVSSFDTSDRPGLAVDVPSCFFFLSWVMVLRFSVGVLLLLVVVRSGGDGS